MLGLRGVMTSGVRRAVPSSLVAPSGSVMGGWLGPNTESSAVNQQQRRTRVTKTKKIRLLKQKKKAELAARGIFPAKPAGYMPKDTPIVNALSREDRARESREFDAKAAAQMKDRMAEQAETLRFHFTDLTMSDRVKKLFDLTNGSQSEVVQAQKERGMKLFEQREGDTGSSAVQVIAITTRIQQLQTHMRTHRKDNSTKRGLDALYVRRRKLLDYMERREFESYRRVVKTLGLIR
eukprot:CAMPEP_0198282750 /NCGR_PEP_ID=MMETSP1449-20131203/2517_1 /TAXON_ID=420275 /ORGANISM="Attheya septentrionalis, Strain CCMP2084" /LENGTH=235 /DNA_ID=CAMNT_0043979137 /DNA_START=57 /DNA_END=764 /DNA_ORIENTATION=-